MTQASSKAPSALNPFVTILLVFGLGAVVGFGIIRGDWITAGIVLLVMTTTYNGCRNGGVHIVSGVLGILAAIRFAVPSAVLLEGSCEELLGITGMVNRLLCVGIAGLLIAIAVPLVLRIIAFNLLEVTPRWQSYDRLLGAVLGMLKGGMIVVLVAVGVWMVEPLATERLEMQDQLADEPLSNQVAEHVVTISQSLRESVIGRVLPSAETLDSLPVFDRVVKVGEAAKNMPDLASLKQSLSDPSGQNSLQKLKAHPSMQKLLSSDSQIDPQSIFSMMNNQDFKTLLNDRNIQEELSKLMGQLPASDEAK